MEELTAPINSHCIFCGCLLNDKVKQIYSASMNDGGTIICARCNGWFHPDRIRFSSGNKVGSVIPAHKYNGTGPLSCKTCKGL